MAAIARVRASLRVFGDALEPEEVSALLGHPPTRAHRKGDKGGPGGRSVEPTGAWILDSRVSEKAEVEDHIESILARLTGDEDEWASLTDRFSASILCSLFLDQYNEGFELSPRVSQALAARGLVIAFDLYSGDPDA
ncbi:MAG: DUF4279 domain-containing protein [Myxococcota bacterium]